ncbi:c-type cytochrome biogenesis protein CcmI [Simplicispira psychrophila]|uniref:c-type cytochrome biogenesis protein CcmI n=1 Tax=Simplicispira psychrophila TaxID=80882 RepID=UPI000481D747|nr:c-type cytochrome biogenesis protein CcmI [Simplicispira psychrophila]
MSVFIALAALLTLLVTAWVVRPLLRSHTRQGVSSQRLNAAIYREQLEALDKDLAHGAISPADHEATRDELQLRLLDDTAEPQAAVSASPASLWSPRRTAGALIVLLPLLSAATYWALGNPAALDPVKAQTVNQQKVEEMVKALAARLQANPENREGWAMLARSYSVMGRLEEAADAFNKAGDVINQNPDLLTDFAEVLAQRADNRMAGRPMQLIEQALAIDPLHPSALMMSGVEAYQRSDFAGAAEQWEKLLTVLEPGSADAETTQANIDEARTQAKNAVPARVQP